MTWSIVCMVFLLLFVTVSLAQDRPFVETSMGKIRGHYQQSYNGRKFAAYEGIPYAKPPIGELRFEEPIEIEPWSGTWDANIVHTCLQFSVLNFKTMGDEDCLYLNVYVPERTNTEESNLLDVIVHIHGGAYMMGDPNFARPEFLMDRNIIYVNLNYRLGVLGFLSTEDDVVPGNNGMKDQVLALRWVQKHIDRFGGNPNSVTLTGVSAGSAATHLHYFSPLSKGLFHRGISQGGTALVSWAIHRGPLEKAKRLAASIGCDTSSTKVLIGCLKRRSVRQVVKNTYDSPILGFPLTPFAPVVERQSSRAFLTDEPYKMLKSGNVNDVPWITGATTEEGILGIWLLNYKFDDLNDRWEVVLPYILDYHNTIAESDKAKVAQKIKDYYLDGKNVSDENVESLIKLLGDRAFHLGLEKAVRLQTKVNKNPVYSYLYGYKAETKFNQFFASPRYYGVAHGSDAQFLYQTAFAGFKTLEGKLEKSDENLKEFFLDVITSFAKNGKPISKGVTWNPVADETDFTYLSIRNDGIKMDSTKEIAPSEFWESLPLREHENLITERDEL